MEKEVITGYTPRYKIIKRAIREMIESGELKPGQKIPSESELIKIYNTSKTPILTAIRELTIEGYLYRIQGKGTYVAERWKKEKERVGNIVFIISKAVAQGAADPFFGKILDGAEIEAKKEGYNLIYSTAEEEKINEIMDREDIEGVILVGREERSVYNFVEERKIPIVLVGIESKKEEVGSVMNDEREGSKMALRYLYEIGYRKIGIIGRPFDSYGVKERFIGCREGFEELGIRWEDDMYESAKFVAGEGSVKAVEGGYEAAKRLLERERVDVIFALTDRLAIGVMKAIKEKGLSIPDDIGVMGYDGLEMAEYTEPALTTVNVFKEEIGKESVRQLSKIIKDRKKAEKIKIKPEIIIRESLKRG